MFTSSGLEYTFSMYPRGQDEWKCVKRGWILNEILLAACKKATTRKWCKPEPPTEDEGRKNSGRKMCSVQFLCTGKPHFCARDDKMRQMGSLHIWGRTISHHDAGTNCRHGNCFFFFISWSFVPLFPMPIALVHFQRRKRNRDCIKEQKST